MLRFNVTYDIVTEESATRGDYAEAGFICQGVSFRDAIKAVGETRTIRVSGVESIDPSDSDVESAGWITITNGMEYETGACESRSIHIPDSVSGASRIRIARLLGVRV